MKKIISFILFLFIFASCKTYTEEDKLNFDKQIKEYIAKHHHKCKHSESGLYYQILKTGIGNNVQYTDNVSFTYKGKLLDGAVFDNQKKPVTFAVKDLISGWKEIMPKLKPGSKVFLAMPPNLGYGDHDLDKIPPNSILIFEMEIISVQ